VTRVEPGLDVRAHWDALRALALPLARDAAEAETLVQQAFERAMIHLGEGGEQPRNPRAWLVAMLCRAFVTRLRPARALPQPNDGFESSPDRRPNPRPAWPTLPLGRVRAALDRLAPELRQAFRLRYIEGKRYREMADFLAISEAQVGARLAKARHALLRELGAAAEESQG
jgi:RNA polymerase sigma-70 factor (ECF subfamily)